MTTVISILRHLVCPVHASSTNDYYLEPVSFLAKGRFLCMLHNLYAMQPEEINSMRCMSITQTVSLILFG